MTPTNRLRFVERTITKQTPVPGTAYVLSEGLEVRILQQWWEPEYQEYNAGKTGEWRDVPLEEEE